MNDNCFNIKVRANPSRVILLGFAALFFPMMVIVLLVGMIGKPTEVKNLWFLWILMIGLSIYSINQLIWEVFGKVQVSFSEYRIEFRNKNSLINKESSIIYTNINSILYSEENYNPFFIWGASTSGNVKIKYGIHEKRIGTGLNKNECLHLVKILRSEIRKRSK
jgi:hypothetical protein